MKFRFKTTKYAEFRAIKLYKIVYSVEQYYSNSILHCENTAHCLKNRSRQIYKFI